MRRLITGRAGVIGSNYTIDHYSMRAVNCMTSTDSGNGVWTGQWVQE